jgi:hypothetical protein
MLVLGQQRWKQSPEGPLRDPATLARLSNISRQPKPFEKPF